MIFSHRSKIHFAPKSADEIIEIPPYSECYHKHPHEILATASGWKTLPLRADWFTGKSHVVMRDRRQKIAKAFKRRHVKAHRRKVIAVANEELKKFQRIDEFLADVIMTDHPDPVRRYDISTGAVGHHQLDSWPADRSSHSVTGDVGIGMDTAMSNGTNDDDVNMDTSEPMDIEPMHIKATRTKPSNANKYKKRMGAKKAKKLELAENADFTLSADDATMYRALSARCNYLAQDRADISYSSKEQCREFSIPNRNSYIKLKRLVRYLCGLPRLVYKYHWQSMPAELDCYTDTDFAGCKETRRSTSGGVIMVGGCCVKHYSKTQSTISLSSGEAELHGIAQGAAQALGVQSLMRDMGWDVKVNIHSDATAAIGICRRKGLGKIRHLDCTDLWIQDAARSKRIHILKVDGKSNPADVLTKYVDKATMTTALRKMNLEQQDGRPACAPAAMGA